MRLDSSGRLGIGDTSPAALLTVGSGDLFQVDTSGRTLMPAGALGAGTLSLSFTADTDTGLYRGGADDLRLVTGGSDRLTISSAGLVTVGDGLTVSGTLAANGGTISTTATTFNLVNATPTTVNFAGAATALTMGASTGTTTVNNSLAVNGGTLSTNQTTFNLVNTNATTVNFAGAATTVNIGSSSGTTIQPAATNVSDLGATGTRFRDLFLSGSANVAGSITAGTFVSADGYRVTAGTTITTTANLTLADMHAASFWATETSGSAYTITMFSDAADNGLASADIGRAWRFFRTVGTNTVTWALDSDLTLRTRTAITAGGLTMEDVGDWIECVVIDTDTVECTTYEAD